MMMMMMGCMKTGLQVYTLKVDFDCKGLSTAGWLPATALCCALFPAIHVATAMVHAVWPCVPPWNAATLETAIAAGDLVHCFLNPCITYPFWIADPPYTWCNASLAPLYHLPLQNCPPIPVLSTMPP